MLASMRRAYEARDIRAARLHPIPLLIVGAPRTGSSFIVRALTSAAGYAGMAEGHVTPLIAALDTVVVQYYADLRSRGLLDIPQNTIANIPENKLRRELLAVFEDFDKALFPFAKRLLDKTVNMQAIAALPLLLDAWPNAKILYLKRDGIENVLSQEKYFNITLEHACINWATCGQEWDRVRPSLRQGSYLEVDHWQLTDEPNKIADQLAEHLELDSRVRSRFRRYVAEHTQDWVASRVRRPPLGELDWTPERLRQFLEICGEQMVKQGYASEEEIDSVLQPRGSDAREVSGQSAKALIEDPAQPSRGLGGVRRATLEGVSSVVLSFEGLHSDEQCLLTGRIVPAGMVDGVTLLVNAILLDSDLGIVLTSKSILAHPSKPTNFSLELPAKPVTVDLLLLMKLRSDTPRAGHTSVEVSELRFESLQSIG